MREALETGKGLSLHAAKAAGAALGAPLARLAAPACRQAERLKKFLGVLLALVLM